MDSDLLVIFGSPVVIVLIVIIFRYMLAGMRHREIMTALEKGLPLPEYPSKKTVIPAWIKCVSLGIGLIAFAPAFLLQGFAGSSAVNGRMTHALAGLMFPALGCFAVGLCFLIRGILLRRYEKQKDTDAGAQH